MWDRIISWLSIHKNKNYFVCGWRSLVYPKLRLPGECLPHTVERAFSTPYRTTYLHIFSDGLSLSKTLLTYLHLTCNVILQLPKKMYVLLYFRALFFVEQIMTPYLYVSTNRNLISMVLNTKLDIDHKWLMGTAEFRRILLRPCDFFVSYLYPCILNHYRYFV